MLIWKSYCFSSVLPLSGIIFSLLHIGVWVSVVLCKESWHAHCCRWFRVWDGNIGTKLELLVLNLFWGFRNYLKIISKQHPVDFPCLQQQEKETAVQIKTSFKSKKLNLRSLSLYSVRCSLCAGYIITQCCPFNNSQVTKIFTSELLPSWIIVNLCQNRKHREESTKPEKCKLALADV